ncbi:hypothetical protein F5Y18DRAFT_134374 [Xylariaceae sp. FL1019]|nr:hypothetical protein F5Y18DRAFT_134374 [Xylariaceae sp. FL1019]
MTPAPVTQIPRRTCTWKSTTSFLFLIYLIYQLGSEARARSPYLGRLNQLIDPPVMARLPQDGRNASVTLKGGDGPALT